MLKLRKSWYVHCGVVACVSVLLLLLNVWGILHPVDKRVRFQTHPEPYSQTVESIEHLEQKEGLTAQFFSQANAIYHSGIAYQWPDGLARVRFRDNWILATAAYLDPLIYMLGLKRDAKLFSQFESFRYERALGRGFGTCSENALGLADLLYRLYHANIHVVGLGGHVVTEAELSDGRSMILDPSAGVVLPFSIRYAERHLADVHKAYVSRQPRACRFL